MSHDDDARQLRNRNYDDRKALVSISSPNPNGGAVIIGVTQTVGTYPTVSNRAYAMLFADIACSETEGSAPTFATSGNILYAVNLGGVIPPDGTPVELTQVGSLYQFTYG